jgi:cytosine/adenosine deaminase-related metal-dependent hydrolase
VRDLDSSLHIHVAEDQADVDDSHKSCGAGVVERLRRHGLLRRKTLLVHGVHLEEAEFCEAQAAGAWIIHCPRSNMNNGVGHARTEAFTRAALGTDGMDEDMLAEARAAFLKMRDAGRADAFEAAFAMLAGGHRLAHALLGLPLGSLDPALADKDRSMRAPQSPSVGWVDPAQAGEPRSVRAMPGLPAVSGDLAPGNGQSRPIGVPADLVILDYRPPTPLTAENLGGHLLFGLDRSHVRSTMVAGRFVLRDRHLTNVDEEAICNRAQAAAERLWERMRQ